ncbi:TPA: ImmA/IrrE family metallo-endopeptidase [Streptococcus suis]|nr:ImmA/IrrE family metallo-endopeptidase [Streptococcus suis]MCK4057804.1 ImmA/IrrE family metallo-endopeptidase [Streptococcus suis]HEL2560115.1 ImmA/IrrE family metallo-endopeptidase [Streptococcus suis]HEL2613021.1 ImmA/IrrE family metallo-endopeptidase [Streptococcus suis]HEM2564822.1 ImmA/IrrE family metallo-endopeptidase [Streptococcus suis]
MTALDLCAQQGIDILFFDGRERDKKAFFNKRANLVGIDTYVEGIERDKVLYHELGHKDHTPYQYQLHRELCELQADRNMIHYLVKEELSLMDDVKEFNYVRFMEKYDLKTTVNETMVIDEFNNLVN